MIDFNNIYSQYTTIIKALLILVGGLVAARIISNISGKVTTAKFGSHIGGVTKNIIFYILVLSTIIAFLGTFEIDLTGVLAAAGIMGIAIGFAAQTSVSNIISGFFLIADKPFEIGEAIQIDGQVGYVLDINLFSTRLRTFDNRYVRLPNSMVLNSSIVNLSRYEVRRLDIPIAIAYKEKISTTMEIIESILKNNSYAFMEPEPIVVINKFGESGIELEARVWIHRSSLFKARTELIKEIKNAFDEAGIEIPFPHRTIYFGKDKAVEPQMVKYI